MSGKHKAIVLLSGGLDSTLAVKMMIDQGDRHDGCAFYQCLQESHT
jgi:tRNA U34 2-thiouridine synthase MnmA/TrmU